MTLLYSIEVLYFLITLQNNWMPHGVNSMGVPIYCQNVQQQYYQVPYYRPNYAPMCNSYVIPYPVPYLVLRQAIQTDEEPNTTESATTNATTSTRNDKTRSTAVLRLKENHATEKVPIGRNKNKWPLLRPTSYRKKGIERQTPLPKYRLVSIPKHMAQYLMTEMSEQDSKADPLYMD